MMTPADYEEALKTGAQFQLPLPAGYIPLVDAIRDISERSSLTTGAAAQQITIILRAGEISCEGLQVGKFVLPKRMIIDFTEWRTLVLENREKPLHGYIARGFIDQTTTANSFSSAYNILFYDRIAPRYSRLVIEEAVVDRLVSQFPRQIPAPSDPTPAKREGKSQRTTPRQIFAQLLREDPTIASGTNSVIREKLAKIAQERELIPHKQFCSASTFQRAMADAGLLNQTARQTKNVQN